jgi:hypothetical protein
MKDASTRQREINGILEASTATGCNNMLIITLDESSQITADDKTITVLPAHQWLLSANS